MISFFTSGSTGNPKQWFRTQKILDQEIETISFDLNLDPDLIINFAPLRYTFGYIFGEYYPFVNKVKVVQAWKDPLRPTNLVSHKRILITCIPTTWTFLMKWAESFDKDCIITLIHSGANIPLSAYKLLNKLKNYSYRVYDLLGSTETGAIGYRIFSFEENENKWTKFGDVSFYKKTNGNKPEQLIVYSNRIAMPEKDSVQPQFWETHDIVSHVDEKHFMLLGRDDNVININGEKASLTKINYLLKKYFSTDDIVALPISNDPLLGDGYAVFWLGHGNISVESVRDLLKNNPQPVAALRVPEFYFTLSGKIHSKKMIKIFLEKKRWNK